MIRVQARGKDEAEILVHEQIGESFWGDGLTSKRFAEDLAKLGDVKLIRVSINSPGGSVSDGVGIYNALRSHGARVEVTVDGLAASIASVVAMAGDTITMRTGALMMIHSPWSMCVGNADQMRQFAEVLDKYQASLVDIYAKRTKLSRNEIAALLAAETWLDGEEAVEFGFADEADTVSAAAAIVDRRAEFAAFAARVRADSSDSARIAASLFSYPPQATAGLPQSASADAFEETTMTTKTASAPDTDDLSNSPDEQAIRARALADDKTRRDAIRARFGRFATAHAELLASCLEDQTCSAQAAADKLLVELGKDSGPLNPGPSVAAGVDARDKFIKGASLALEIRAGLQNRPDVGNEFSGMTLSDLAAQSLSRAGHSIRGLSRDAIARKVLNALTSSDFPNLLSSTAGKVLQKAYGSFPATWQSWALAGEVSDFKIHPRIQIGSFNNLATIPEGGEYTYGDLAESYENAQALTKGKAIAMTRQMVVNDDLGAFVRRAQLMGRAAARSVNSDAYTHLTGGANNHGPTSADTGQYFNATATTTAGGHANLTDTGTAITTASIALGRKTMRVQKDQSNREVLNILPKILLTSATKEDIAWAVLNSTTEMAASQSNPARKNYALEVARLNLVTDPFLDGINSATPWYLFADPMDVAAFEVVFLDGNQTPFIDDMVDWDTDALKFKVRLDYGIANGDWRAAYLNDGA